MGGWTTIDNPVINSPYTEPARHFEFTDDGITDRVIEGRRPSAHVIPTKLQVELRGADVSGPTTGEVRTNPTDDVACWFIDTDDNEEAFFVRHAYFTAARSPTRSRRGR